MQLIELMLFAVINVQLLLPNGQLYCRAQATTDHESNQTAGQEHLIGSGMHHTANNSTPSNHRTNPNETAVPKLTQRDETADQSSRHGIALDVDFLERPDLFEIGQSFFMPSRKLPPVTQYQRVVPAVPPKQRNLDDSPPVNKPTGNPRPWSVSFNPTDQIGQSAIRVLDHGVGTPATSGEAPSPTSLIKFDDDDNEAGQPTSDRLQESGFVELIRLKGIEKELEHKLAVQKKLIGSSDQIGPHDSVGVKSNETGAPTLGRSSIILLQQSKEQMRGLLPVSKQTVQHPKNKLLNLGRFALTNMKRADRLRPIPLGASVKMPALSREEPQELLTPVALGGQLGVAPVGQVVATRQSQQAKPGFALNEAPGVGWQKPAKAKYKPKPLHSDQAAVGLMFAPDHKLHRVSKPRRRGQATKRPNYWSAVQAPASASSLQQEAPSSASGTDSAEDDEEETIEDEPGLDGLDLGALGVNYDANQLADFASYGAATQDVVPQGDVSQLVSPFAPRQTHRFSTAKHSYLDFTPSMPSLDEALRFAPHYPPVAPAGPASHGQHSADATLAAYPRPTIARRPQAPPRNWHQHWPRQPVGAPGERAHRYRSGLLNVDLDHLELGGSHSHKVIHVHTKEKKKYGKYLWPILGGGLTMLMGFLIISNMLLSIPLLAIGASSLFNQGGYHTQQLVPIYNLSQLARPVGSGRKRRRRREATNRDATGQSLQLNQLAELEPRDLIERVLLGFASGNLGVRCRARAAL